MATLLRETNREMENTVELMLHDIKLVWPGNEPFVSSKTLLNLLLRRTESPWLEWREEFPKAKYLNKQDAKVLYTYVKDIRRYYNQGKQGHDERNDKGEIVGYPKTLSEPYDAQGNKCTQDYGPRWLQAVNKHAGNASQRR